MKRNKFIATMLAAAAIPSVAFTQNKKSAPRATEGFKVEDGEGRLYGHIQLKGVNKNIMDVKVSGKDTDGDLAMFEQTSLTQGKGTPLHIHPNQDEVFRVIEGEYYFQCGEKKFHLKTGDNIFLPRNVPHAWTQVSEKGKMMVLFQPAGKMENFFLTIAGFKNDPTPEEMAKMFIDNDMKIVGPPLKIE